MDRMHELFLAKIERSEGEERTLAQSIYADWLEEQGDQRAELLRLTVLVRRFPPNTTIHATEMTGLNLWKRALDLIGWHNPEGLAWARRAWLPCTASYPEAGHWSWDDQRTIGLH